MTESTIAIFKLLNDMYTLILVFGALCMLLLMGIFYHIVMLRSNIDSFINYLAGYIENEEEIKDE